MADLEQLAEERQIARADDGRYFDLIMRQSDVLASSRIVPAAYRGRSADIVAAGLAGRAFGWDVMASMRNFHVIEGTASLRPEAMLGLVRQAGHSVMITSGEGIATAVGKRCDSGDEHTATFTLDDAKDAGLAEKKNWRQYQEAMLQWRAVSKLCRALFSDMVLGAGYVPEEIGADTDETGLPKTYDPMVPVTAAKNELLKTVGDKANAKELWGDRGSNSIRRSELDALISDWEAEIVDAEITEAPEQQELDDGDGYQDDALHTV